MSADELPTCPQLRILDLCTGTGCIPLLLHAILSPKVSDLQLLGIDISREAVALANQNLHWNIRQIHLRQVASEQVRFAQGDIFGDTAIQRETWDIVISNPPYISPRSFTRETSRSVRNYEPKSALVPSTKCPMSGGDRDTQERDLAVGDAFYPRLLEIAEKVNAKLLLVEVADMEQAKRVVDLAVKGGYWEEHEIWRDWPDQGGTLQRDTLKISGRTAQIVGQGHGRSVLLSRSDGVMILGPEYEGEL